MKHDPIADFLVVVKNGVLRGKTYVDFPASKIIGEILKIMQKKGFITNFKKITDNKQGFYRIFPAYNGKEPVLKGAKRISKPGRRIYTSYSDIPLVMDGFGICIVSTPKGVFEGEEAKKIKQGGEILCYIW